MTTTETKTEDYLIGYSVNVLNRSFLLYSSTGATKEVTCETPEQFLNVLEFMENTLKKEDWFDTQDIVIRNNIEE
jgi:hypothetical protein